MVEHPAVGRAHGSRPRTQIFAALRDGKPLPKAGTSLAGVEMSAANITVPVVDHDSAGKATGVQTVLADAGFIAPGIEDYATYGADVKGSVIAYEPGHDAEARSSRSTSPA